MGDAATTDGSDWTSCVRREWLYDGLSGLADGNGSVMIPDVKYGTWSERGDFRRAPIRLPPFDPRVHCEGGSRPCRPTAWRSPTTDG